MEQAGKPTAPLDLAFIREFCDLAEQHDLMALDVSYGDFHLKVTRAQEPVAVPMAMWSPQAVPPVASDAGSPTVEMPPADVFRVCAPLAGVFYRSPGPELPAFVEQGGVVAKGQVLCIIEAMKMMNEIASDVGGQIVEILVANGQVVESGQEIFYIKPASRT